MSPERLLLVALVMAAGFLVASAFAPGPTTKARLAAWAAVSGCSLLIAGLVWLSYRQGAR